MRESADLKPIGTILDQDFDLYIKKLDCFIVTDQGPFIKPSQDNYYNTKPSTLGNLKPEENGHHHVGADSKPSLSNHLGSYNPSYFSYKPTYAPDYNHNYLPSGIQNVQTLVSVASGPDTILHPVHDIIVSKGRCGICGNEHSSDVHHDHERPPFRPQVIDNPYGSHHRPEYPSRPIPSYHDYYHYEHGHEEHLNRPYEVTERPEPNKVVVYRPNDK